jgi:hypothetical protein
MKKTKLQKAFYEQKISAENILELSRKLEEAIKSDCIRKGFKYERGLIIIPTKSKETKVESITTYLPHQFGKIRQNLAKNVRMWYLSSLEIIRAYIEEIYPDRENQIYLFAGYDSLVAEILGGRWKYVGVYEKEREPIRGENYSIEFLNLHLPKNPTKVKIPPYLKDKADVVFSKLDAQGFTSSGIIFTYKVLKEKGIFITDSDNDEIRDLVKDEIFEKIDGRISKETENNWTALPPTPFTLSHLDLPGHPYGIFKPIFLRKNPGKFKKLLRKYSVLPQNSFQTEIKVPTINEVKQLSEDIKKLFESI